MILPTYNVCGDTNAIQYALSKENGEVGLANGSIYVRTKVGVQMGDLMVWVNPETSDYTLTVSFPDGISCIIGHGEGFGPASPSGTKL